MNAPSPHRHAGRPVQDAPSVTTPRPIPHPAAPMTAVLLVVAIVLVALNLRPALTSIGPLLGTVSAALGISSVTASLVTTLPVLCLGAFGPVAPLLARRMGLPAAAVGAPGLFAGSLMAGAGIGITGVLLPGVVKQAFPERAGLLTGIYTMALCGGAAVAAGLTAPIAEASGSWALALGVWAVPAIVAALVWWPSARHLDTRSGHRPAAGTRLLASPLAWSITLYMGLQSSLAYSVFGWLPSILQDRGVSVVTSGLVVSVSLLVQTARALVVPMIARHHVALGCGAGHRPGRQLFAGAGDDRAAGRRCDDRGPDVGHGAECRLYAGGAGAARHRHDARGHRRLGQRRLVADSDWSGGAGRGPLCRARPHTLNCRAKVNRHLLPGIDVANFMTRRARLARRRYGRARDSGG